MARERRPKRKSDMDDPEIIDLSVLPSSSRTVSTSSMVSSCHALGELRVGFAITEPCALSAVSEVQPLFDNRSIALHGQSLSDWMLLGEFAEQFSASSYVNAIA
mmetsp:Transcript_151236/g.485801  ORF Transcript_151236/g.485801 Transcript_151236/m.485801 type:complete len:104 (+) Transcript_151236:858-1169(+)